MIPAKRLYEQATAKVTKQNLPVPARPKGTDPEIEFPDDPAELTGPELSQKMMRAAGWYAFNEWLRGRCESELVAVDAEYRYLVNTKGNELRQDPVFKNRSGEIIEAEVLLRYSAELSEIQTKRVELLTIKPQLESRSNIYDRLYAALSREQSRRESQTRVTG